MKVLSYKVTVEITVEETKNVGRKWLKVGEKEVPRDERFVSRGVDEPATRIEEVMGYTPDFLDTVQTERKVFEQTVTELDMRDLVSVVNGMPPV